MDGVVRYLAEVQAFLAEIRSMLKEVMVTADGGWDIKSPVQPMATGRDNR